MYDGPISHESDEGGLSPLQRAAIEATPEAMERLADTLARYDVAASYRFVRTRQAQLRRVLLETVTPEDIACITETLIRMAEAGDVRAAKLLFAYKPPAF